jgi:carbonic anhydrase/acetyltransferase-like protein (isoleucine patch superfamily)
MIIEHGGHRPLLGDGAWVAQNATVIGDVVLGARASIWFGAVVRGDVEKIRIGADSNIQDLSVVHVDSGGFPTLVGDQVTVGHRVILHGCTIGSLALIGMGSIVMNGADIGAETIIGAGSLVSPGTKIPSGVLALGSPCKVRRTLTEAEKASIRDSARRYAGYGARYREDQR